MVNQKMSTRSRYTDHEKSCKFVAIGSKLRYENVAKNELLRLKEMCSQEYKKYTADMSPFERRKLDNRISALKSRIKKQAEFDDQRERIQQLEAENQILRDAVRAFQSQNYSNASASLLKLGMAKYQGGVDPSYCIGSPHNDQNGCFNHEICHVNFEPAVFL